MTRGAVMNSALKGRNILARHVSAGLGCAKILTALKGRHNGRDTHTFCAVPSGLILFYVLLPGTHVPG